MLYKRFEEGRENIKGDQRSGRPSVVTSSHVAAVKQLLDNDRRITIRDIVAKLTTVAVQCRVLLIIN